MHQGHGQVMLLGCLNVSVTTEESHGKWGRTVSKSLKLRELSKTRALIICADFTSLDTTLLYFIVIFLATLRGMWDVSSLARDRTPAPRSGSTGS